MGYDLLPSGAQQSLTPLSPWQMPFAPGLGLNSSQSLANLFNLYNYWQGQQPLTISSATNLPTVQDGPIQVFKVGNLTVNSTLGFSNRCRGGILLCDSLTMGASGVITAPGGAAGSSKWLNQDILIPPNAVFTGKNTSWAQFQAWIAANNFFIFDPTLLALGYPGMGDIQANPTAWPGNGTAIISAAGCGAAVFGLSGTAGSTTTGYSGTAGTNGPGAGGESGGGGQLGLFTGPGRVWGGGSGSAGSGNISPDPWGGYGGRVGGLATSGGAGNPSGNNVPASNGTGGILLVFSRGPVSLTSGHLLTAPGMPGESDTQYNYPGGGGSGGGKVGLYYEGTLTGTPNLTAPGGAGGSGRWGTGGSGGAGQTEAKPFSAMGY